MVHGHDALVLVGVFLPYEKGFPRVKCGVYCACLFCVLILFFVSFTFIFTGHIVYICVVDAFSILCYDELGCNNACDHL